MAHRLWLGDNLGRLTTVSSPDYANPDVVAELGARITGISIDTTSGDIAVATAAASAAVRWFRALDLQPIIDRPALATVNAIAYSPDGAYLACGLNDSPWLRIYDTSTWQPVTVGSPPSAAVYSLGWNGESTRLAVGSATSPWLAVYDISTWQPITSPVRTHPVIGVSFSPAGDRLLTLEQRGANSVPLLLSRLSDNLTVAALLLTSETTLFLSSPAVAWSPSGHAFAAGWSGGVYGVFNANNLNRVVTPNSALRASFAAFTPDGSAVIFSQYYRFNTSNPSRLQLFQSSDWSSDPRSYALGAEYAANARGHTACAFSPDGSAPVRAGLLLSYDGTPLGGVINVIDRKTWSTIKRVPTNAQTGEFRVSAYASDHYVLTAADPRGDAAVDDIVSVRIDTETADLPPIRMYVPTTAPAVSVGNVATRGTDGGPVDAVVIRHWESRRVVAIATPDEDGAWSAALPPGKYDISYLSDGCLPVCHGPYTVLPAA